MPKLTGLIAATYTPFHADGSLNTKPIPEYVDFLLNSGVSGLYVCGSTGEGVSLTGDERRVLAEAFVKAAAGRVPVIVQVGHNCLREARELATHAADIGADVISATCPFYFKPASVDLLIASMAEVAAGGPNLPFYYYHIPSMTGVNLNMTEFLSKAADSIPNLAGLKFTSTTVHEFQSCLSIDNGRFDILWGCDEMLLSRSGHRGSGRQHIQHRRSVVPHADRRV
ncbi:MAG: dihydrodipicolinate synthase family protein [Planctomycetaceae bacterium]